MSGVVGVIVAGGKGSRMGVLGSAFPKALLPVGDAPVIGHHLRLLRDLDARDVHVVVGHLGAALRSAIGDGSAYGLKVHWVEQGPALGSAHALGRVRGLVNDPFILILGDYYFATSAPERLTARLAAGEAAITVHEETGADLIRQACEVRVDGRGRVTSLVEKPANPTGSIKGCGVYALHPDVFESVARTPRTALRDEYELTHALDLYVRTGRPVFAERIFDWDTNLTRPVDLLACNLTWLARRKATSYVADDADVAPEVALSATVVGAGAAVRGSASLANTVVFPGSTIELEYDLDSIIITPSGLIDCRASTDEDWGGRQ